MKTQKTNNIKRAKSRNTKVKIGVFDSGLGGLTVVKSMLDSLRDVQIFYIADTANAPYGDKSKEQIIDYSSAITNYFLETHQIDILVIACNTATSAAALTLREKYPNLPIVGTEPGIKPALNITKSSKVGILATSATLRGEKYHELLQALGAKDIVALYEQECPGLVEQIELDQIETSKTAQMLEQWLSPMREQGVDTIVLGCTHYPLAKEAIRKTMQRDINLIETGEAIANRIRSLSCYTPSNDTAPTLVSLQSTAEIKESFVKKILGEEIDIAPLTIES